MKVLPLENLKKFNHKLNNKFFNTRSIYRLNEVSIFEFLPNLYQAK